VVAIRLLILWAVSVGVALILRKIAWKDLNDRKHTMSEELFAKDQEGLKSTEKHFKITTCINCVAIVISSISPFPTLCWLSAAACGMVIAPVLYDVVYNCLPNARVSKMHLCATIVSVSNILLIAFTLNYIYWAHLHVDFT